MTATWKSGALLLWSAAALGAPCGGARADDIPFLPQPLAGLGSLPSPLNWLVPNYAANTPPNAWTGFFASPLINYQGAEFTGNAGGRLRSAHGFTFGAEAGYNYQIGPWVLGPAADLSYSLMQGGANGVLSYGGKAEIGWVGSARVRAGYAIDRWLVYGTAGVAFADMRLSGPFVDENRAEPGWTAGGGVQYLWSPRAIFQIEYRRLETNSENFASLPLIERQIGIGMNLINAGFYFKF